MSKPHWTKRIKAVLSRIAILPPVSKDDEISKGGIVLPYGTNDKFKEGLVFSVGPEVEGVEVDDHVIYMSHPELQDLEFQNDSSMKYSVIDVRDVQVAITEAVDDG